MHDVPVGDRLVEHVEHRRLADIGIGARPKAQPVGVRGEADVDRQHPELAQHLQDALLGGDRQREDHEIDAGRAREFDEIVDVAELRDSPRRSSGERSSPRSSKTPSIRTSASSALPRSRSSSRAEFAAADHHGAPLEPSAARAIRISDARDHSARSTPERGEAPAQNQRPSRRATRTPSSLKKNSAGEHDEKDEAPIRRQRQGLPQRRCGTRSRCSVCSDWNTRIVSTASRRRS